MTTSAILDGVTGTQSTMESVEQTVPLARKRAWGVHGSALDQYTRLVEQSPRCRKEHVRTEIIMQ